MRQKRAKTYRKLMNLYSLSFGFRQPYQVLVDSEFCKTIHDCKFDTVKQLHNVLQGEVKPMITQCCIHELYLQGKSFQPVVDLAKTFERRKCNHRDPIPGDECLTSVVGPTNKHRYVVATQSSKLRGALRAVPGVPIVHMNRSVTVLEPPSEATLELKKKIESGALEAGPSSQPQDAGQPPKKKQKGPKGPNPLSVKKKASAESPVTRPKKRSRTDMLKDEIPEDIEDEDKELLQAYLEKHEDLDVSNMDASDWTNLAEEVRNDTSKKRRKRRRKGKVSEEEANET